MNYIYWTDIVSQTGPTVNSENAIQWVVGGIAGFILIFSILKIADTLKTKDQQRTVTGVAVTSGLLMSLGLSPLGTVASTFAQVYSFIPVEYSQLVKSFLSVNTAIGILLGLLVMIDTGGVPAALSFILGFIGGVLMPYDPIASILFLAPSIWLMEISPASSW